MLLLQHLPKIPFDWKTAAAHRCSIFTATDLVKLPPVVQNLVGSLFKVE